MKNNSYLMLLLFTWMATTHISAQQKNHFFLEFQPLRFSENVGSGIDYTYELQKFSFLNGIEFGYGLFPRLNVSFRFRGNSAIPLESERIIDPLEQRMEFSFGTEFTRKFRRKLYLSYGIRYFSELLKIKESSCFFFRNGTGSGEYTKHRKSYRGLAFEVNVNYKFSKKHSLVWTVQMRQGTVETKHLERFPSSGLFCQDSNFAAGTFAPIGKLGFRIQL